MKIKDVKTEMGRIYVRTWVNALNGLLGWSEERTLAWAEKFRAWLDDEDDLLFHWTPSEYIMRLIIPEALNKTLNADEKHELKRVLLRIIERHGCFSPQKPNYDWHLAKRLIDQVFRQVELLQISGGRNVETVLQSKRRKFDAKKRLRAIKRSRASVMRMREILREAGSGNIEQ